MSLIKDTNSYVDVAEADTYFADRLDVAAWIEASADQKAQALITATSFLDSLVWVGNTISQEQLLAFPRVGEYYEPFHGMPTNLPNAVPKRIKEACMQLAYHSLNNDGLFDDTGEVESISISGISLSRPRKASKLPGYVKSLIRPLLRETYGGMTWWRAN